MQNATSDNQFVIQEHSIAGEVHWDLMLERKDKLWTWRLEKTPSDNGIPLAAERIFDHPLKFLTYEGPVQNGTGRVAITDKGGLRFIQIESETIRMELDGSILKGQYALQLDGGPLWVLTKIDN